MKYAGTNYRDMIMDLVDEDLITYKEALLESLAFMSMDDNRRVYQALLEYCGVDTEGTDVEEPIVPMNGVEYWREYEENR